MSSPLKTPLLKLLDDCLGVALVRLLPAARQPARADVSPKALLLIRPGGIGDAVHLVPGIQAIGRRFPAVAVDVLAEDRNRGAFHLCPGLRRIYRYDHPAELLRVLGNRYDVVVDTEQWYRLSAVVARVVRAPLRIGFATNERARLFSVRLPYRQDDYEADSFLRLLEPLGIGAADRRDLPWLQVADDARRSILPHLPPAAGRPLVAIFPGASIAEKCWPPERFHTVAAWCRAHALPVILVGGRAEVPAGRRIAAGLDVASLIGTTTLAQTAAVLERAAVVVAGDSGVLHIAAGLGRPTVALFGPSPVVKWAPRGERHITLVNAACSPCSRFGQTPQCPRGISCMCDITVADVTGAIGALLELPAEVGRS